MEERRRNFLTGKCILLHTDDSLGSIEFRPPKTCYKAGEKITIVARTSIPYEEGTGVVYFFPASGERESEVTHVSHGTTSYVDYMVKEKGTFRILKIAWQLQ